MSVQGSVCAMSVGPWAWQRGRCTAGIWLVGDVMCVWQTATLFLGRSPIRLCFVVDESCLRYINISSASTQHSERVTMQCECSLWFVLGFVYAVPYVPGFCIQKRYHMTAGHGCSLQAMCVLSPAFQIDSCFARCYARYHELAAMFHVCGMCWART